MSRRSTCGYASAFCVFFALGCSNTTRENPRATARAGSVSESKSAVTNAFPMVRGDVPAARARASVRLSRTASDARQAAGVEAGGAGILVLYDETGPWGWLGELYAIGVGSLVSHFGVWTAQPVSRYRAGELSSYAGAVYVGSTFDEPLPTAFLDDVLGATRPVVWIDDNIWQLAARSSSFAATYGFEPWYFDTSDVAEVDYKGTPLTRYVPNTAGIMTYSTAVGSQILAEAVRVADGTKIPWAVRGKNLTYIGENPLAYVTANDRYLAFCDLLFDAFCECYARAAPRARAYRGRERGLRSGRSPRDCGLFGFRGRSVRRCDHSPLRRSARG